MCFEYDPERDSLTDILKACGYTHRHCAATSLPVREILNAYGEVVFSGVYGAALEWLVESGQAREQAVSK